MLTGMGLPRFGGGFTIFHQFLGCRCATEKLISPEQFQPELDLAGGGGGAGDGAGGTGLAGGIGGGGRSEDDQVRNVKVRAVEEIENFGAELKAEAFADRGIFQNGKIPRG